MQIETVTRALLSDSHLNWDSAPPAEPEKIEALIQKCEFSLPAEYLQFLSSTSGGEGSIGHSFPGWFRFFSAESVLGNNEWRSDSEYLPKFFAFGDNGGGEMYAFNVAEEQPWKVYCVPYIGSEDDAILIAESFVALVRLLGHEDPNSFRCVAIESGFIQNVGWIELEGKATNCNARCLIDAFPELFEKSLIIGDRDEIDLPRDANQLVLALQSQLMNWNCCIVDSHKLFVVSENVGFLKILESTVRNNRMVEAE